MIGDFMTKPLQGASFRKFRDYIMGVQPTTDNLVRHDSRCIATCNGESECVFMKFFAETDR
jgi:hypothetical protein